MTEVVTVTVTAELANIRSDRVISSLLPLSRGEVRRIFDAEGVSCEERLLTPSSKLAEGSVIAVVIPERQTGLEPTEVAFDVVMEDEHLAVIDKPAGLVVHPGAGTTAATLVAGLVFRWPQLASLTDNRWGLVHRLDRDTSGLLVIGKTVEAHATLQAALKRREVSRTYLALVQGVADAATGTIDAPIGRDPQQPTRMAVRNEGRDAITHYRRLAGWEALTLKEVTLETGRTHQIRVHMSAINHPIVGDSSYGGRKRKSVADPGRQWLHAWRLAFAHPVSGQPIEAEAPPHADLQASLATLDEPLIGSVPEALTGPLA